MSKPAARRCSTPPDSSRGRGGDLQPLAACTDSRVNAALALPEGILLTRVAVLASVHRRLRPGACHQPRRRAGARRGRGRAGLHRAPRRRGRPTGGRERATTSSKSTTTIRGTPAQQCAELLWYELNGEIRHIASTLDCLEAERRASSAGRRCGPDPSRSPFTATGPHHANASPQPRGPSNRAGVCCVPRATAAEVAVGVAAVGAALLAALPWPCGWGSPSSTTPPSPWPTACRSGRARGFG